MSIGLPGHLRPQSVGRAFARTSHVVGFVCLLAAFVATAAVQAAQPEVILWPALLALIPMFVMLWLLDRRRTLFYSVSYVIIGGASIYWFALTVMSEYEPLKGTDSFVLSMPRIALMLVGGSGLGIVSAIVWGIVGLTVAEVVILIAALQTGVTITPDRASLVSFGMVVLALLLLRLGRRKTRRVQPDLNRAARDEHLAAMRYRIEAQAAAVMHDTILNHLAAIASARDGRLGGELKEQIERDLETVVGEEWLADASSTVDVQARADWQHSQLFVAIEESRRLGLEVEVSGELVAIAKLGTERSRALGLAVKQCLVNVLKHSGTDRAEVVIYGSGADVTVMVIDAGRGFSEEETGADRLGLKQSVRRRMEAVGGEVHVWSTPGRGTSVMIRVPVAAPSDSDGAAS